MVLIALACGKPFTIMEEKTIKARELKQEINAIPDEADVFFGTDGDISFFRVKRRGDNFYQIEFNEQWEITSDPTKQN